MEEFNIARRRHNIFQFMKVIIVVETILCMVSVLFISTDETLIQITQWIGILFIINCIGIWIINNHYFDAEKILVKIYYKEIDKKNKIQTTSKKLRKEKRTRKKKEYTNKLRKLENDMKNLDTKRKFFQKTKRRNLWVYSKSKMNSLGITGYFFITQYKYQQKRNRLDFV